MAGSLRPIAPAAALLLTLCLAPAASATPTTILTDPAGDAHAIQSTAFGVDHLDILGATLDSDGTNVIATLSYVDLTASQPFSHYYLYFTLTTAAGSRNTDLFCTVGDHGTGVGAVVGPVDALDSVAYWRCTVRVPQTVPGEWSPVRAIRQAQVEVPSVVDLAANTIQATIPYSTLVAASGSTLSNLRAETSESFATVGFNNADQAAAASGYTYTFA